MLTRVLILMVMLSTSYSYAQPAQAYRENRKITAHVDIVYLPISKVESNNFSTSFEKYDNISYRVSFEYYLSELVSVGPAFEYMHDNIDFISGYFNNDITLTNYFITCNFNHSLLDSGASYMIFGAGTGYSKLNESNGTEGNGFSLYGLVGFDIALHRSIGVDLYYRYQVNNIIVDDRTYRFDGSVIQAGLNYRIIF